MSEVQGWILIVLVALLTLDQWLTSGKWRT
jgi:hypothetical protein